MDATRSCSAATRLSSIRWAAAAYAPVPAPGVQRIGWRDISADIFEIDADTLAVAVKGTDPEKLANLARDADIKDETCREHPRLGPLFEGAFDAAEGLLPLIMGIIGDRRLVTIGHSLGGEIAVDIAGELEDAQPGRIASIWGYDPPKSGDAPLVSVLAPVPAEICRFTGSVVSRWPFERGMHIRAPVLIGDWTADWLEAHSIDRAAAWVAARELVPA